MPGGRSGFAVTITAQDAASKQIDAINARIRALQAPSERLAKSFGRLADTTGITRLTAGMRNLAGEAFQAFENIGRIGGPLGAITGVATLAGISRLASQFANVGSQLRWSAQQSGVSVDKLAAWQGAAQLAGSSAQAMTSGVQALKDNMFAFATGTASAQTIVAFDRVGASAYNADGSLATVEQTLPKVLAGLSRIKDPTLRMATATSLLGGAARDLWPVIEKGAEAFAENERRARSLGSTTTAQAEAAERLRGKIADLSYGVEQLGTAIGARLEPVLGPVLADMSKWLSDHRELIATTAAIWADDYAKAFKAVGSAISSATGNWINWNKALEVGLPLLMAQAIPGVTKLEAVLARLALLRIPAWLGALLGIGTAGTWAGLGIAGGAYLGYKGAVDTATKDQRAQDAGFIPLGYDEAMNPTGYKDASGRRYTTEEAFKAGSNRSFQGEHWEPEAPAKAPFVPLGTKIWNGLKGMFSGGAPGAVATDPRGIRNNNPLNLSYVPGQQGVIGSDGRFGVYGSMQEGIAAEQRQLLRYQDQGLKTMRQMVNRWAPPGENDSGAYTAAVAKQTGLDPDKPINMRDPVIATKVIRAMGKQETGRDLDAGVVRQGVDLGLGTPPVTVQNGTGVAPPATPETTTVKGSAEVKISLGGFPPGTRTIARSSGDLFNGAPRVETAMAGFA